MNKQQVRQSISFSAHPRQFFIKYKEPQIEAPSHQHATQIISKSRIQEQKQCEGTKNQIKFKNKQIYGSIQKSFSQPNSQNQRKLKQLEKFDSSRKQIPKTIDMKIPIDYYDQNKDHEIYTKKMIYKGYTPRSSYYYLKTLKQINIKQCDELLNIRKDSQLAFNSKFQSGNLNYAIKISQYQYHLFMRQDTNTKGLRQWFYFQVCNKNAVRIKFRIYKFNKRYSLYRKGYKPFVLSKKQIQKGYNWIQKGQNIRYEYDSNEGSFYLQFQYLFQEENQLTYFATLPPYTYSQMNQYVNKISGFSSVTRHSLGLSLSGLEIPVIEINESSSQQKQFIVVLARTHPGETVSNFALQGFIQYILNHKFIKSRYNFIIVPMVNVDGVYIGNHRTGILGQDLNRLFDKEDQFYPQITAIKKLIKNIKRRGKIRFLFDLHGHSAKRGIFAFGGQQDSGSAKFLFNRIIPLILRERSRTFNYESCVFKNSKQKKNCARMYFMKVEKIIGITFEESYGLYFDENLRKNVPIGITNWKNFGICLAQCLVQFNQMIHGKEQPLKILREYMKEEIQLEQRIPQQKQFKEQIPKKIQNNGVTSDFLEQENISKVINVTNTTNIANTTNVTSITNETNVTNITNETNKLNKANSSNIQNLIAKAINNYKSKSQLKSFSFREQELNNNKIIHNEPISQDDKEDYDSINNDQLQSEDQQYELTQLQVNRLKKRINFFNNKEDREKMNIPEKHFELDQLQYYRIKNQKIHQIMKSHIIPKIFKQCDPNIRQRYLHGQSYKLSHFQLPQLRKKH